MDNSPLNTKIPDYINSLYVGLETIDQAIYDFLKDKITIESNGELKKVPLHYVNSELWFQIKKKKYLRDRNNKLFAPIVVFRRTNITKDRSLYRIIDYNNPQTYISTYIKNPTSNYRQTNQENYQIIRTIVPQFVDIDYEFIAWTYYISEMNHIIELFSDLDGSYWGDLKTYRFLAEVDSFSDSIEINTNQGRIVRSNFSVKLKGYLLPKNRIRQLNTYQVFTPKYITIYEDVDFRQEKISSATESNSHYDLKIENEIQEEKFPPPEKQNPDIDPNELFNEFLKEKNL